MLNKKLEEALNAQINAEFWSAYLYLSMSSDMSDKGMAGVANWFAIQFKEEQDHAMKFFNYVISRGGKVTLKPIEKVDTEWKSPLAAFEQTLQHEEKVTSLINDLYALAEQEKDYATQSMLKWFIDEQVEEEENAKAIIDTLKLIGDNGYGLYQLDKELATRVYTPIATSEE
ncbi:MAG: ferritin [Candidatus Onthomorpha sp.]|nr:ferritin [Bacteroidales bacterium]MDY3978176.1 ferritin [Candidatus Onthomorpha sp.]MCI5716568.1 ferritin [Bacteroidales bacterium]MCI6416186.1 ferritin [Bacteroidales bacterium]MCI6645046.1 ferritin [Bacteroidales bacterium]